MDWEELVLYCYMEAFILLSGWCSIPPSFPAVAGMGFLSLCWNLFHVPPLGSSFFCLWLTNDGERGPWWELEQPGAEGGSVQITTKFLNCVPGKYWFWFYFLLLVKNCNWTVGSHDYHGLTPIKPPNTFVLKFLLNQNHLVSMWRESLRILYIKLGIEKFLWLPPGQYPIHSSLWE